MKETLIVARMDPKDQAEVSRIFAESDRTGLPQMLGVRQRRLFSFHGLYMHLIESEDGLTRLDEIREHPLFADVNERLSSYISAYDEATWSGPRDAMATNFYHWTPGA